MRRLIIAVLLAFQIVPVHAFNIFENFQSDVDFLKVGMDQNAFGINTLYDPDGERFLEGPSAGVMFPEYQDRSFSGSLDTSRRTSTGVMPQEARAGFVFDLDRGGASPATGVESGTGTLVMVGDQDMVLLAQLGIIRINGTPDLDESVTRGELAAFAAALRYYLERYQLGDHPAPVLPIILDAPNDDPRYKAYVKAAAEGLIYIPRTAVFGVTLVAVHLDPQSLTTQAQALQSIVHALDLKVPEAEDVPVQWYDPYVQIARQAGILETVCSAGCRWSPDSSITRRDLYRMAVRALGQISRQFS